MTFQALSEQRCSNCRYSWITKPDAFSCHRTPPQIGPRGEQWPAVEPDDWCGEWVSQEAQP